LLKIKSNAASVREGKEEEKLKKLNKFQFSFIWAFLFKC